MKEETILTDEEIYLEWLNTTSSGDQKRMLLEFARRIEQKIKQKPVDR